MLVFVLLGVTHCAKLVFIHTTVYRTYFNAIYSIFLQPVQLMCNGEGPVVHVTPLNLDWGQIPVLTDVVRVVTLSNESLVPSKFTAHMVNILIMFFKHSN